MLALAPSRLPSRSAYEGPQQFKAESPRKGRVALLSGCAQSVLAPNINEATIRLLTRMGLDVVLPQNETCCGALVHHMGKEKQSHAMAAQLIDAWMAEHERDPLDAIVITASGCGTTIKDYGFMFRDDPAYAEKAATISALAKDITEIVTRFGLPDTDFKFEAPLAYHSACSMQHGQQLRDEPKKLLAKAGFQIRDVPEGHICCGSAGTYNLLQPELAGQLRNRKVENIRKTKTALVATGNIGCMTQIAKGFADRGDDIAIVHTVELLDWATGGPKPEALH